MSNESKSSPGYVTIAPGEIDHYVRVGARLRSEAVGASIKSLFAALTGKGRAPRPKAAAVQSADLRAKVLHGFTSSLAAIRSAGEVLKDERDLTDLDRARFTQIILNEEARLESLLGQLVGSHGRDSRA